MPAIRTMPLGVLDLDRHRGSERAAVADAAEQRQLVDLETLPWPASVAQPAAAHLGLDLLDRDRQPGRQPFDDDDEGLAVRLTGGQEAQHAASVLASRYTPR
jgi:hypothetical protein